jgi:hypothetical protein
LELNGGEAGRVYCVGACHGKNGQEPRAKVRRPRAASYLPEEEGAAEARWWTPYPREQQFSER